MSIIKPYTPIRVKETESIQANVLMRSISFGEDSLPESIIADGEELLAAPIKIVGVEDGHPIEWSTKEKFIFSRSEEELIVCGAMQSEQFIVNTNLKLEFDGCLFMDFKLVPRGKTVAQVYGTAEYKQPSYHIENLILEIPLKKSAGLYHVYPNCDMLGDNETLVSKSYTSGSGSLPETEGKRWFPFRPLLWLGNENRGLCFFSESAENWQPAEEQHVLEIVDQGDARILRVHLLDSHPKSWRVPTDGSSPSDVYRPLDFTMGLEATPVKQFPKNPYLHNALHIDCFKKVEGDYQEFLYGDFNGENGYDRMKRLGVTTLVLHEKWNKVQNFPYLSEPTAKQVEVIIEECHSRGIKVIPYFGYEIATLSPLWSERSKEALMVNENNRLQSGWWRVPPQRDYNVCYNSSWQDTFVEGIKMLIEKYHFDGIYLDSALNIDGCTNTLHGCGWIDKDGKVHPTHPIRAVRNLLKRIYEIVEPLGGIVNYHSFGFCNIPAMGFTHLGWMGESIQLKLIHEGVSSLPLGYFRTEYTGRNFGIPQELIAYENRPKWTFEQATSFALIHGILPRPNDIEGPLEFISGIWKIFDRFPFEQAEWVPYWENKDIVTGDDLIQCSFYKYEDILGEKQYLIFVANMSDKQRMLKLNINPTLLYGTVTEKGEIPSFGFGIYAAKIK